MIKKLLVANRGEIACRIIKTARRMNIETLAIYSSADKNAMHVKMADQAHQVGEHAEPQRSYLNQDRILEIAQQHQACAIHPGYGFLSENSEFAQRCGDEQVIFVGPSAASIKSMGIKNESKRIMISAGVPVVPGYHGDNQDDELLLNEAAKIGYPVMIKPVRGGGGKGMRVVYEESKFLDELESSRRESLKSFNDKAMLLEKYIEKPRHVEVQIFGDTHGNHVYLFERDCSVQRRHQKIIEEAPAPLLSDETRRNLGEKAVAAAKAVNYVGAGTVEFILDKLTGEFYFMEMNTRLQVEHPITEMITNTDLVEWQLRVASGEPLPRQQDDISIDGHAFEARIYAESPSDNFLPQTGQLRHICLPDGLSLSRLALTDDDDSSCSGGHDGSAAKFGSKHIRLDTGVATGDNISPYYDPMIAKLVVWGPDRRKALDKLSAALGQYVILGLPTNVSFLNQLAANKSFKAADIGTDFIDLHMNELFPAADVDSEAEIKRQLADKGLVVAEIGAFIYSVLLKSGYNRRTYSKLSRLSGRNQIDDLNSFRMLGQKRPIYEFDGVQLDNFPNVKLRAEYQSLTHQTGQLSIFINEQTEPSYEGQITFTSADNQSNVTVELNNGQDCYKFALKSTVMSDKEEGATNLIMRNSAGQCRLIKAKTDNRFTSQKEARELSSNPLLACAPMPGIVEKILVKSGDRVKQGQSLVILSAMKMEYTIKSACDGHVAVIKHKLGDFVAKGSTLIELKDESDRD